MTRYNITQKWKAEEHRAYQKRSWNRTFPTSTMSPSANRSRKECGDTDNWINRAVKIIAKHTRAVISISRNTGDTPRLSRKMQSNAMGVITPTRMIMASSM
ncbi:hypothetical protein ACYTTR_00285 [Cobetia marina]